MREVEEERAICTKKKKVFLANATFKFRFPKRARDQYIDNME